MDKEQIKFAGHISADYCRCVMCIQQNPSNKSSIEVFPEKSHDKNCMHIFLEYFPKNFPLPINPTTVIPSKIHYFNRITKVASSNSNYINNFTQQYRLISANCINRITQFFPLEVNINIFYENKTGVVYKYELNKSSQDLLYIQGYNVNVPLTIYYEQDYDDLDSRSSVRLQKIENTTNGQYKLDDVLSQKLSQILIELKKSQGYSLSDKTRQFFNWAHRDYGDEIFCYFVTKLYCSFVYQIRRDIIKSGTFYWLTEKNGIVRLANVKDLVIDKFKPIYSFQQEYQEKIKEKINIKLGDEGKLFKINNKPKPSIRLNNFRANIKNMYENQKVKILKETQNQRVVQTETMSDDIARLFLPQLRHYTSLREVLSDQQKFRRVVLGEKPKRRSNTINRSNISLIGKQPSASKRVNAYKGGHLRSHTQI